MRQKYGRYICVQILQTLNILFENIRDETSLCKNVHFLFEEKKSMNILNLDYLLSNNHVNNIILHKFDFSDEEITAYYISVLKTLSLKLNKHSINFFYNEVNRETKTKKTFKSIEILSSSEQMTFHCMSKQLNSLIIPKQ